LMKYRGGPNSAETVVCIATGWVIGQYNREIELHDGCHGFKCL